jgi:hypothetical protein
MEKVFDYPYMNMVSARRNYVSRKLLTEMVRLPFDEMTMECSPMGHDIVCEFINIYDEYFYSSGKKINIKMNYNLIDFDSNGNEENTFILYNYSEFIDSKIESLLSNKNTDYQYKYTFK